MNHSRELLKVRGSWEFQIYSQLDSGLETKYSWDLKSIHMGDCAT